MRSMPSHKFNYPIQSLEAVARATLLTATTLLATIVFAFVFTHIRNASAAAAPADGNLLKNGNFVAESGGRPTEWAVADSGQKVSLDKQEKPEGAEQSLRVDVAKDAGEGYGEILQAVKIKPSTQYRLQGDLRVTQARLGIYQIKLFKAGKEIGRIGTEETAPGKWQTVAKEFSTKDADGAQVLCRWRQNRLAVGQTAWFARVSLTELGPAAADAKAPGAEPVEKKAPFPPLSPRTGAIAEGEAIPTFESVGIYWSLPQGSPTLAAQVAYRASGETAWKAAQDLWFDTRTLAGRPPEYRGSIVGLKPGTKYEVRLTLAGALDGTPASPLAGAPIVQTLQVATWCETFPIAKTVELPAASATMLEIKDVNGSPDGYILYTGPGGAPANIAVANQTKCNIRVMRASYLILRGLNLTGAQQHGIMLGDGEDDPVHDIVIENSDISDWGANDQTGFGVDHHSGVFSNSAKLERVVIQRNRIHNPRSNANSWKENRKGGSAEDHPLGPQAISFMYGRGRYVVRYNEFFGDPTHHFNDSMGADRNFSFEGYPNRDSDIYGNYIAYCWDDGLEIEGANMNVRVWGNYITETYHPIATAAVSLGPLYIFRNVAHIGRTGPKHAYGQSFMKSGGSRTKNGYFGDGRVYLLNNTVLILPGKDPQINGGLSDGDRTLCNYVTRNNILQVPAPNNSTGSAKSTASTAPSDLPFSISDTHNSGANSFDYDLYNGRLRAVAKSELHGIVGVPIYAPGAGFDLKTMTGNFTLAPNSPGHNSGAPLPNFTEAYTGPAPDIGAHQSGTPPMQFGVKAYLPSSR
ncbi:MAG: right-handed parallel beta-helix repeat-containing protein [Candidatus Sumerlaeota bacterium]|nr:right-handed parallel beta-helix repeat-containing protein [Candidatus Sumerlaeota bacterium]